jgi:asparagine synthase (glutamine-hydrolysing)
MPGLIGLTLAGSRPLDAASVVARMQRLITHPRYNVAEPAVDDGLVCAARSHTGRGRGPAQPAAAGGRRAWLDGEIINAAELAPALSAAAGDARLILELTGAAGGNEVADSRHGVISLAGTDGAFCAVVSNPAAGVVQVISDRFGLRPLYWTVQDGRLLWSSNLGGFLGYPGFTARLDARAVDEFMTCGHVIGARTLFAGVELLEPATVLTFTVADAAVTQARYWEWGRIRPVGPLRLDDAADELGRVLIHAIAERARPEERVAVSLSGGLDSRAILAATPPRDEALPAVTFGRPACVDIAIARRVAALKGACHEVVSITSDTWLAPRFAGVWWTDGQLNLTSMHGMEAADVYRDVCDLHLDGYGGDFVLGGMYMGDPSTYDRFSPDLVARRMKCELAFLGDLSAWEHRGRSDYYLLQNRARRMNNAGTRFMQVLVEERKPFLANAVVEFALGLPDALRARGLLYRRMLLRTFPAYYRRIPWASIGVPISWPRGIRRAGKVVQRIGYQRDGRMRALGIPGRLYADYTDYPAWLRTEPARGVIDALLRGPEALYPEHVSRDSVLRLWGEHLAGADHRHEIGRRVTLEIWLQQVYAGRFRPVDEGAREEVIG